MDVGGQEAEHLLVTHRALGLVPSTEKHYEKLKLLSHASCGLLSSLVVSGHKILQQRNAMFTSPLKTILYCIVLAFSG